MSINRVIITGNLTRNPDLRATQGGMQVLSFGVAVNERYKNQHTGEWEDRPNFIDCTMFGNRAESVSRYISKGSKVAIEGRLKYSSWESNGQKRSKLEVIVDQIEFLSRSQAAPQAQQAAPQAPTQAQSYGQQLYQQAYPQQAYTQPQPAPQVAQQAPQPQAQPVYSQAAYASQPQAKQPPSVEVYDEDIPF